MSTNRLLDPCGANNRFTFRWAEVNCADRHSRPTVNPFYHGNSGTKTETPRPLGGSSLSMASAFASGENEKTVAPPFFFRRFRGELNWPVGRECRAVRLLPAHRPQ